MADEEFISEYKLTLSELVTNAKITINVLSMLADENKKSAQQIADTIEERIRTAIPVQKLPALYLIDSIIKNVKDSEYLRIFTKNIVSLFICVFERGDERIRSSMYKLRQTWVNLFPNDVLLKLDLAVTTIDPAWPITAVRPVVGQQTVHINPDFFDKAKEALKGVTMTNSLKIAQPSETEKLSMDKKDDWTLDGSEGCQVSHTVSSGLATAALRSEAEMLLQKQLMAKQLLAKQQELLQIQQRRVEIELTKAQMQIEEAKQQALQKQNPRILPINDTVEDKSPKKLKTKRNVAPSGEDLEEMKNETASEECTSPLKIKSLVQAAEQKAKSKVNLQTVDLHAEKPNSTGNELPTKPIGRKRKSGDIQKVDPRLRKKMMTNKDSMNSVISPTKLPPENNLEAGLKVQGLMTSKELSEDLKDLFGNEDKDFRTCVSSTVPSTAHSDAQWKVLKSEGQNVQAHNFAQQKVSTATERRTGIHNRFGSFHKGFGLHANRKTLLPTPPVFGQDLKQKQKAINNFEKLQEMKKELDVEAERLSTLAYDASENGDLEAFEADVMRGNSLLNNAHWNNWKNQERGAKRMRHHMGNEQFHNGPSFGNRPHLLHAPPRASFPDAQQHRPSPPHQQFPHQPSPPQFNQPRSPGQNNFGYGRDNYMEDDYNFNNYGSDGGCMTNMDQHYHDENNPSSGEPSWGYRGPNPHNAPMMRPNNPGNWQRPQQPFSQPTSNFNGSQPRNLRPNFQNNFNAQNNSNQNIPNSQASEQQYVNQLFSKLTQFGILNNFAPGSLKAEVQKMSDFNIKKMKIKHKSLIEEMKSGTLCRTCGLTFPATKGIDKKRGEEQAKQRYIMHLDWHFQVNKKMNSIPKSERCREYYPDQDSWYHHEVVNVTKLLSEDGSDRDANSEVVGCDSRSPKSNATDEKLEAKKEKYKDNLLTFVYKNTVNDGDRCFVCTEGFENYWDDEKEEWGLKEAYKLKEKLFHAGCFVDYDELEISTAEQSVATKPDHADRRIQRKEEDSTPSGKVHDDITVLSRDNKNVNSELGVDNKNAIEKMCDGFAA